MRRIAILVAIALLGLFAAWGGTTLAWPDGAPAGLVAYPVRMNVLPGQDPAGHAPFIGMPSNITLQVETQLPNLVSISGPSPFIAVHGTMDGTQFSATGMGTVTTTNGSTFPNVAVQFMGQLMGDVLSGDYAMGTNRALPSGQAITYQVKPKPQVTPTRTATRTPTPEQKSYRITVLKRNDDTKQGLPGWRFNIYAGSSCNGNPFHAGVTDENGLLEFVVPVPGQYSVREKLAPNDPDWNNVTPLCQNVTAGPGGAEAAAVVPNAGQVPPCPIPNGAFPAPGCDTFSSLATVKVLITNPNLGEFACDLSGPTQIVRRAVVTKPPDSIDTEIVFMKLTGSCAPGGVTITVRESPTRISAGRIVEQQNGTPGTLEFPANSFFDVFFEVVTPAGTFHNETPGLHMTCKIDGIPPYGCFYEPPIGPVPIYDPTGKQAGVLVHASHLPIDPKKDLVIFINAPKRTPTRTPTPVGINTPTRTSTATPTKTPQQQRTRYVTLRCVRTSPSMKVTGSATITEKKPGQPDRIRLQASCNSNTNPVVSTSYSISAGATKNYRLDVTVSGRSNSCSFPGYTALQPASLSCTASPDGLELAEGDAPLVSGDGDVNKNGVTNAIDVTLMLQHVARLFVLEFPENADVDQDGDIDAIDAALTLQTIAGLIPGLPI